MKKVTPKKKEVDYLNHFIKTGNKSARTLTRARVLLLTNDRKKDKDIQDALNVGRSTIWRIRLAYSNCGLMESLAEKPRPGQPSKYDEKKKAEIIAFACTTPPSGRKRWTVRLLADELKKKSGFKTINRESIRLTLKKTTQNLG